MDRRAIGFTAANGFYESGFKFLKEGLSRSLSARTT